MASFKFQSTPFTVESPDVGYTDEEILSKYVYETVVVEGAKVCMYVHGCIMGLGGGAQPRADVPLPRMLV